MHRGTARIGEGGVALALLILASWSALTQTTEAFLIRSCRPESSTRLYADRPLVSPEVARHSLDRRHVVEAGAVLFGTILLGGLGGQNARAEGNGPTEVPLVRDKMGGTLEPYTDIAKGVRLFRPSGWNQFDGDPTTYIVKWSDIVNRDEQIVLNATPVKASTTSVSALGSVEDVAGKLKAARQGSKLASATARTTEGLLFYQFEFEGAEPNGISEMYELTVNKGKLWSLSATTATKRWSKRKPMFESVLGSFVPKL